MKTRHTVVQGAERQQITVESTDERQYAVRVGEATLLLQVEGNGARYRVLEVDGTSDAGAVHDVGVEQRTGQLVVHRRAVRHVVSVLDERQLAREAISGVIGGSALTGELSVCAPMPGRVVKALVGVGDSVDSGQGVIVVEAMKMENELASPAAGVVTRIDVSAGDGVEAGQALVVIDAAPAGSPDQ